MEAESFGAKLKRRTKKVLKITVISLLLIAIAVFSFLYFATYEEGVMTFGALKGTSPIAESFDFSIYKSETTLIEELQKVSLSGERVNLYFVKHYMTLPWRGDTKYFVTRVERLDHPN